MIAYLFQVRGGLSLADVNESDVEIVLKTKIGCCGRPKTAVFKLATEEEISRWLTTPM